MNQQRKYFNHINVHLYQHKLVHCFVSMQLQQKNKKKINEQQRFHVFVKYQFFKLGNFVVHVIIGVAMSTLTIP